jgi:hypothetical protein
MTRQFFQTVSMAAAIALGASAILQQPSQALPLPSSSPAPVFSTSYTCTGPATSPKLVAEVRNGGGAPIETFPLIVWDQGPIGGLTPSQRCNSVKLRFNALAQAGKFILQSAGPNSQTNQQRIICLVSPGEPCNANPAVSNILFTLRPGDNVQFVLSRLATIGQRLNGSPGTGPLHETSADEGDISIDLNEYIRQQVDQMQRGRASSSKTSDTGSAF